MNEKFAAKLTEFGISYKKISIHIYSLYLKADHLKTIRVQFLTSKPIDKRIHGGHNGNVTEAIVYFKLRPLTGVVDVDFLIMAFDNHFMKTMEYIVIPPSELVRRTKDASGYYSASKMSEFVFWLMPDRCLYETFDISPEGEWYFLSKGVNGRMADKTSWCYTPFLNNWNQLLEKFNL